MEKDNLDTLSVAIREGIARTPADPILTDDVLAAIRMPMSPALFSHVGNGWPKGARCTTHGVWFLVLRPRKGGRS